MAISDMLGKVIVQVTGGAKGAEALVFQMSDGTTYVFHRDLYNMAEVEIEDVCGDVADLIGSPLTQAEEAINEVAVAVLENTQVWTFYKFATNKGGVTIRWFGSSNGCYSERVEMEVFRADEVVPTELLEAAQLRKPATGRP